MAMDTWNNKVTYFHKRGHENDKTDLTKQPEIQKTMATQFEGIKDCTV
jgi:hypothetical protein